MSFVLYRDRRGEYRWRLRAANGRTIGDSGEGYKTRRALQHAIRLIRLGASSARFINAVGYYAR